MKGVEGLGTVGLCWGTNGVVMGLCPGPPGLYVGALGGLGVGVDPGVALCLESWWLSNQLMSPQVDEISTPMSFSIRKGGPLNIGVFVLFRLLFKEIGWLSLFVFTRGPFLVPFTTLVIKGPPIVLLERLVPPPPGSLGLVESFSLENESE